MSTNMCMTIKLCMCAYICVTLSTYVHTYVCTYVCMYVGKILFGLYLFYVFCMLSFWLIIMYLRSIALLCNAYIHIHTYV